MANSYFNHVTPLSRFTTADANRLNAIFTAIESGFGKLPSSDELNQGTRGFSVATGTANTYSVTVGYTITNYQAGLTVNAMIMISNTGSSTLNVNGRGQATIKRADGTNLQPGDLRASSINTFIYDGTAFRLTSFHGASEAITSGHAATASTAATNAASSATQAANSATSAAASATSAQSSATQSGNILTASRFGFRNVLLNPVFWLSQWLGTGASAFTGTYSAGTYIRDRWKAGSSGITFTIANYGITITAGSLQQIVQGRNILQGGIYTLSWTGTSAATVNGVPVANGGQFTLAPSANATVTFGVGTMSNPQLELSSVKTQFEHRPTDLERELCFQYYQRSYGFDVARGALLSPGPNIGLAYTNRYFYDSMVRLPVKMRGAPAITFYSYNQGQVGKADFLADIPVNISPIHIGDSSFFVESATNSFSPGGFYYFHWIADAEL
jgi:hypothetical protein